ncbi:hypothetical protein DKX38_013446 [Salix brachista]|uniref:Uncharacterized protein n=1 Tax=Salix brachista TaxID=2182728 RepID=A0A5N5LR81_9ROSI|nr:hypothetical protein DKX38_013446 [Salix brachista]
MILCRISYKKCFLHAVLRLVLLHLTNDLLVILIRQTNTMIYQDVFSCVPNDLIHTRAALRQSMVSWKDRLGHTTIDFGIAPQKLASYQNGDIKNTDPLERLQSMRGHLVSFPLEKT